MTPPLTAEECARIVRKSIDPDRLLGGPGVDDLLIEVEQIVDRRVAEALQGVEALVAKYAGCWCGVQMAPDHDPRVRDCPQHGDGAAEHFCRLIEADLRAALTAARGGA